MTADKFNIDVDIIKFKQPPGVLPTGKAPDFGSINPFELHTG